MNLKEYIEKLQKLYEEQGDLKIVYGSDDEGNSYNNVVFDPSLIYLNGHDSIAEEDLKECDEDDIKKCICIN